MLNINLGACTKLKPLVTLWFSYKVLKYKEKVELIFGCSSTSSDSGRRQIFLTCSIKLRQWSMLSRRDITLWYLSEELFYHENYISIEYGQLWLFLFTIKKEISTQGKNSTPFLFFQQDHLWSKLGIICSSGTFAVQFGDRFWSGELLQLGIICIGLHYFQTSWLPVSGKVVCKSIL